MIKARLALPLARRVIAEMIRLGRADALSLSFDNLRARIAVVSGKCAIAMSESVQQSKKSKVAGCFDVPKNLIPSVTNLEGELYVMSRGSQNFLEHIPLIERSVFPLPTHTPDAASSVIRLSDFVRATSFLPHDYSLCLMRHSSSGFYAAQKTIETMPESPGAQFSHSVSLPCDDVALARRMVSFMQSDGFICVQSSRSGFCLQTRFLEVWLLSSNYPPAKL